MAKNSIIIIIIVVIVIVGGGWWYVSVSNHQAIVATIQQNTAVGTWVSAVKGKGVQASGQLVLPRSVTQITLAGDVQVVIEKVENNVASGTISYNNVCYTSVTTITGRKAITEPAKCVTVASKPIEMQVDGNKLSFTGATETGGTDSFVGYYSNGIFSGTFTRESSYGKLSGTFSLVRQN